MGNYFTLNNPVKEENTSNKEVIEEVEYIGKVKVGKNVKIVFVGNYGAGKTCIISRFVNAKISAIAAAFYIKKVEIEEKPLIVEAWDAAGEERYVISRILLRDAQALVLVVDLTSANVLEDIEIWLKKIYEQTSALHDNIPIFVVGNKCDAEEERKVSRDAIQDVIDKHDNIELYMEVSAKNATNINEFFLSVVYNVCGLPSPFQVYRGKSARK